MPPSFMRQGQATRIMRSSLLKKGCSTKAERRFAERLKALHIPYKAKVKVGGREVDFVCGKYAIEIDGHKQDPEKNVMLVGHGYTPLHYENNEVNKVSLKFLTT